jgi:hypothetical protein
LIISGCRSGGDPAPIRRHGPSPWRRIRRINLNRNFLQAEQRLLQKKWSFLCAERYSGVMNIRVASAAAVLLTGSVVSAAAHDYGCRHGYRHDYGYAIQLPRRYVISPAQNFDAWHYGVRNGISRYRTGCGSNNYFWDGSQCARWTIAADGTPLPR